MKKIKIFIIKLMWALKQLIYKSSRAAKNPVVSFEHLVSSTGYEAEGDACFALSVTFISLFSANSSLTGTLYTSPDLIPGTEFNGGGLNFLSDSQWLRVASNGLIEDSGSCEYPGWDFSVPTATSTNICGQTTFPNTYYSYEDYLGIAVRLFSDQALLHPLNGGNKWYKTPSSSSYQVDTAGYIINMSSCAAPYSFSAYEDTATLACATIYPNSHLLYSRSDLIVDDDGMYVYTTPMASPGTEFMGDNKWYKWSNYVYRIDDYGLIIGKVQCS